MSKKYSIGYGIGMLCLIIVLAWAYQYSYDRAAKKRELEYQATLDRNAMQADGAATKEAGYIILDSDGYVAVYYSDRKTVYEYTSIKVDILPADVQEELKKGIVVANISELYGFLENYSS